MGDRRSRYRLAAAITGPAAADDRPGFLSALCGTDDSAPCPPVYATPTALQDKVPQSESTTLTGQARSSSGWSARWRPTSGGAVFAAAESPATAPVRATRRTGRSTGAVVPIACHRAWGPGRRRYCGRRSPVSNCRRCPLHGISPPHGVTHEPGALGRRQTASLQRAPRALSRCQTASISVCHELWVSGRRPRSGARHELAGGVRRYRSDVSHELWVGGRRHCSGARHGLAVGVRRRRSGVSRNSGSVLAHRSGLGQEL